MSKLTKIASILALSLAAAGTANAVEGVGSTSTITGLKWVADLTSQVTDGNMVVVDAQNNIVGNGTEFELKGIQSDLSIQQNGTETLYAKSFDDTSGNGDGIAQQGEVDLSSAVSATWSLTAASYEIDGNDTGSDLTIKFNTTAVDVDPSSSNPLVTGASNIAIGISATAPTDLSDAQKAAATNAVVTLSILATQDA